jgi:hypothetical protein
VCSILAAAMVIYCQNRMRQVATALALEYGRSRSSRVY